VTKEITMVLQNSGKYRSDQQQNDGLSGYDAMICSVAIRESRAFLREKSFKKSRAKFLKVEDVYTTNKKYMLLEPHMFHKVQDNKV
jgi:hypothetical protein